jgi:hypothetical protein
VTDERRDEPPDDVPGDDVPEYPGEGGRETWLLNPRHINIEDLDEDDDRLR